ncbi:MAG: redoxin domain-containing protein [Kiloniellaceae bacterium]
MVPLTPEQARLEVGDRVPDMGWLDQHGDRFALTQSIHAGRVSVLFICSSLGHPGAARELATFAELYDKFRALDAQVFAVTAEPVAENAAAAQRLGLPFPILSDAGFASGRAVGLAGTVTTGTGDGNGRPWCTVIVNPNQRVAKLIDPWGQDQHAIPALAYCSAWAAAMVPTVGTPQAPVLIVPDVLSPEHCARLIDYWEKGERYEGGVASGEYGRMVPVSDVKVREDVLLPDLGPEAQEIFAVFRRRLFPEVRKAFNFRITRAETLRVGCYDAADGGHFRAHRDDTTPYTAHRRFAVSVNLNAGEYEGGFVTFPEYGPQLFRADIGGAAVFSCSMLHEVTKVTSGRRFILLGFFYSEAEEALRQSLNAQRQA